jgi:ABC-type uncharacterized transport system permease subunit
MLQQMGDQEGRRPRLWQRQGPALRMAALATGAVLLAFAVTAVLILVAGQNPWQAYAAMIDGAVGSPDRVAFALNRSTPLMLAGVGVALCFRAQVINIGAEGQIAVGGLAASWVALNFSAGLPSGLLIALSLGAGAVAGAGWAAIAALIRLTRGVHEVISTLLLNFVGVLLVSEVLQGAMGDPTAGFPESPLFDPAAWLPRLFGSALHGGIVIAVAAVLLCHGMLWHTPFGFRLRLLGGSRTAAAYAGVSFGRGLLGVMLLAGALAGLGGAVEVLGVNEQLIEGFSQGFGFSAVVIALLAAANPVAVLPAGLFFGFLQAGALAMQRQVGVPSSLVFVIEGLTILFVLCAMGVNAHRRRV